MNWFGLVFVAVGSFAVAAAFFDWDWFMNHRKARLFVKVFGRTGARAFYALIGAGLIALGLCGLLEIIDLGSRGGR